MPRPYSPEFRQRALDLVRSDRPVPEVAELLGIARVELANAIFEYIEGFHNRRRRHSALGYASR